MTKIADSYFIDPDTGKRIPVRMEYTGVFKPDTTMITTHNVYRLNNGVAEKLDGSGWRQPNTDDPNYWKTNIRQAANNQEEPLNSVKYYWNKFTNWIKENKNGGNMNYASYLQGGGHAPLNAAPQVSKEDIAEIITAALLGTDEVKQQASEMLQSMLQDDSIAPLVLQVMEEMGVPMQKCGGRVKKKALGSKLIKTQKAKCGCELKKVGGRLIEVDSCTGLPIHRNGAAIKKYEKTPGPITYALQAIEGSNTVENNLTAAISDSFKTGLAPTLYSTGVVGAGKQVLSDGSKSSVVVYKNGFANPVYKELDELGNETGEAYYNSNFIRLDDGSYVYKNPYTGNQYYNNGRYYDVKTGKTGNYDMFSFFNQTPNNINKLRAAGFVMGPLSTKVLTPATDGDELGTPKTTWRDTFGAGKSGKFGGLTYDQALARQQEMLNADWFNAQLGSNGLTKRGDDGMWGETSQKEYARYLAEKQRREEQAAVAQRANDQLRQQKFVEEIAPSHPLEKAAIIPPKTPAIVKPQGLLPTAELIKSNTLTAMLGQNTSDRRMAKYGKAYDFIKTGANSANMSAADTRRANRLATKMHKAGLMENGGQLNYANYLN